ncbi:MAG: flagellar biosynthetic protein FliR [Synergistaceae bacterium]|jgi:flagellar biosynthetic protein FliR|nr:flagellar biosynthetic protein FliR [Synergistaceae bacterium]
MMDRLEIPVQLLMVYFLIHLRFVGMMFTSSLFVAAGAPLPLRFLGAVLLTVIAAGTVRESLIPMILFENWISISILALREFLIGTLIGLLAGLPLFALQTAGEQIGMAMGLSMANAIDPMTQSQTSLVSQIQFMVGLWFYFRWNGHLLMVQSVVESLRYIPLAKLSLIPASEIAFGVWVQGVFRLAMKMVIPYYCALLLADVGLGFLARTVPQMNVFILGLPLKVGLGLFVLMLALPLTVDLVHEQLERWIDFALKTALIWR